MLALAARVACAQSGVVRGSFADTTTRAPVAGVQVRVTAVSDSADVRRTVSADDGTFRFDAAERCVGFVQRGRCGVAFGLEAPGGQTGAPLRRVELFDLARDLRRLLGAPRDIGARSRSTTASTSLSSASI